MPTLLTTLINDQAGFIVFAELVLVSTIAVLGMVVGLSEVALNVNSESDDVGSAFGAVNQTYCLKGILGHQAYSSGTEFHDNTDFCDNIGDIRGIYSQGESNSNW